jgi:hypothetical protein
MPESSLPNSQCLTSVRSLPPKQDVDHTRCRLESEIGGQDAIGCRYTGADVCCRLMSASAIMSSVPADVELPVRPSDYAPSEDKVHAWVHLSKRLLVSISPMFSGIDVRAEEGMS